MDEKEIVPEWQKKIGEMQKGIFEINRVPTPENEWFVVESFRRKKNLLITIGDSWTAGSGAYDSDTLEKLRNGELKLRNVKHNDLATGKTIFAQHSWPWLLAEKLDWDLINLGEGGISNVGAAKKLISDYDVTRKNKGIKYHEYNKIILLFLLTGHERHSFYSNEKLLSVLPLINAERFGNEPCVQDAYYEFVTSHVYKSPLDCILESRFAVKSVEAFAKGHGMDFLFGSAFINIKIFNTVYKSTFDLHNYIPYNTVKEFIPIRATDFKDPVYMSPCKHPNREGYKAITDGMYELLKQRFGIS